MDFTELCAKRYSVRKFSSTPVEPDKIKAILEAGRLAPTAKNLQPQHIYVLSSDASIRKIRAVTPCAYNAPMVLVVCGRMAEGWVNPFDSVNHTETDVSIVTCHMMLKATELELGTVWVGWFDAAKVSEALNLPEGDTPFALLPLGYPADDAVPAAWHSSRKPLDDTVTYL